MKSWLIRYFHLNQFSRNNLFLISGCCWWSCWLRDIYHSWKWVYVWAGEARSVAAIIFLFCAKSLHHTRAWRPATRVRLDFVTIKNLDTEFLIFNLNQTVLLGGWYNSRIESLQVLLTFVFWLGLGLWQFCALIVQSYRLNFIFSILNIIFSYSLPWPKDKQNLMRLI